MRTVVCSGSDVPATVAAIDEQIAGGLRPTLAIVFSSVAHDLDLLRAAFWERRIALAGVSTAGEIANGEILEEGCSAMLLEADRTAFSVWFGRVDEGPTLFQLATDLGRAAVKTFANPAVIVFASGIRTDGEAIVHGARSGAGRAIPLFGGMAGDDLKMLSTYVFADAGRTDEGVVAIILDADRFRIEGIAMNGWQAVGVEKTVTKAIANVVYTIDGEPAVDMYHKYLDMGSAAGGATGSALSIGVSYPLSVQRESGPAVLRAPLFYGPEPGSLIFAGAVPEGARIKFCIPPSFDIVERVVGEARDVQQALPDADALLLVSCKARHIALGPLAQDEVEGLNELWQAPQAGFFSYGEIGAREAQHTDFHTDSCTLVVLKYVGQAA